MYFFMKGLQGEAADATGSVGFMKLFLYAQDKTKVHVWKSKTEAQTPVLSGKDYEDFEFVKLDPTLIEKANSGRPEEESLGATRKENQTQSGPTNPMAAILVGQADRYFASGDYDSAVHTYANAINLDPTNTTIYPKRGAAYLAKGDVKMAVADYQAGGRSLALTVAVANTNLMAGVKITAAVHAGQTVTVTKLERESNIDWLWVEAVDGNTAANGYIKMEDVVKKPTPPPAATQANVSQNYETSGGYDDGDDDSMRPAERSAANAVDRAWDNADRHPNNMGLQRAAERKEESFNRKYRDRD
jgi:tetratricopeptide (TPR) repeat protein